MSAIKQTPWLVDPFYPENEFGIVDNDGGSVCRGLKKSDAEKIVECVNACAGQSIEDVRLATVHKDAAITWEKAMKEVIGEDGIASVVSAISDLKERANVAETRVKELENDISQSNKRSAEIVAEIGHKAITFIHEVHNVRKLQKEYFRTRSSDVLNQAKKAEKELDKKLGL